jgi:hypothetical protein
MMTLKVLGTARRNLWYCIDRYLAELEKRASQPGRREGDQLLRALDHLEAGTYAEGERDVMWAEVATRHQACISGRGRAWPWCRTSGGECRQAYATTLLSFGKGNLVTDPEIATQHSPGSDYR